MEIQDLANSVNGKIVGNDEFFSIDGFTGKFTFLNDAHTGDIVIRHWINGDGVHMAFNKNIACLITQTPKDDAIEMAEKLSFPLIITDKIELANAYALSYAVDKFSPNSTNIVITGTNGKSTTSHLIYHILKTAGFHVLTNTDSESEFNTQTPSPIAFGTADISSNTSSIELTRPIWSIAIFVMTPTLGLTASLINAA